jgi:hypothetical protein
MLAAPKPNCPKCGKANPLLFSSRLRYAVTDHMHRKAIGTAYFYSCRGCGANFQHDDDVPPVALAVTLI